jgi:hypothetical protein
MKKRWEGDQPNSEHFYLDYVWEIISKQPEKYKTGKDDDERLSRLLEKKKNQRGAEILERKNTF